jgi:hypothetical protein
LQNQKQYKMLSDMQEKLLVENGVSHLGELDMNDPQQAEICQSIMMAMSECDKLNKDYKDMLEKIEKLQQSLNATRRQREEKGRVGGDTFFSKCQEFTQKSIRQREGRYAELLRLSTQSNTDKMRNGIPFLDGEVAPQLLDAKTIELMDNQKKEENKEEIIVCTIVVNGMQVNMDKEDLVYNDVVKLSGFKQDTFPSIVYSKAVGEKSQGAMTRDDVVTIQNGTVFEVAYTGNA